MNILKKTKPTLFEAEVREVDVVRPVGHGSPEHTGSPVIGILTWFRRRLRRVAPRDLHHIRGYQRESLAQVLRHERHVVAGALGGGATTTASRTRALLVD